MAARRWATLHPCDCGGHFARETFFQASRMIQYTCNHCGQTILVPYEDAGVL
jgi:predicted SprT family Zn-dependent metalloprotease